MEPEFIVGTRLSSTRAEMMMSEGWHPSLLEVAVDLVLFFVTDSLPAPPVSTEAPLSAVARAWVTRDGVDRLSRLPDEVLRNVVSRLPAKDAARTAVLASRWRRVWRSAPLVLVDAHLVPAVAVDQYIAAGQPPPQCGLDSPAAVGAVSRALAAHPGPFRCVHLTRNTMAAHQGQITRWLQLLAVKGVQELVFINRPWPIDIRLPPVLFSCGASLTSLHIGVWRFPDTAALPRRPAAAFPHLRELGLYMVVMGDRDLAFLLVSCPVLERLHILGSQMPVRLRLVSRTLRCLLVSRTSLYDIVVVDAPLLEKFFLYEIMHVNDHKKSPKIKIVRAPKLRILGYIQPGTFEIEIGNTVIKATTKPSASTTVPSVKIMAFVVKFAVRSYVKMLPSFLKCFPDLETLHFHSDTTNGDEPTGKAPVTMWQEAGAIECVHLRMKKVVFHEFKGSRNELLCLKFIAERARMLEEMVIVVSYECFSSRGDVKAKLKPLLSAKWDRKDCKLSLWKSPISEGGSPSFSMRLATDGSSFPDPFDLVYYHESL